MWFRAAAAALLWSGANAYVPFPDPPQPLPQFAATWSLAESTIVMPCNYTGGLDPAAVDRWGIVDIDWSNDKAHWVNTHPMTSEEELVAAAQAIKDRRPQAKVWVYRNLVWAPSWFSDIREKIKTHPEWFVPFKAEGPTINPRCTFDKCSDRFHSQFQTMAFHGTSVSSGICKEHCDCGDVPCAWYLWNHHNASCREWLVREHLMGPMGMGAPSVDGLFIDDVWAASGPELEGPGSEAASHDSGMSTTDNIAMMQAWRTTMDAANEAVLAHKGYTWRLFYNNWTCAQAPFDKNECEAYMDLACAEAAPLDQNALFYGFSGETGCSPDHMPSPTAAAFRSGPPPGAPSASGDAANPIIDLMQHLASFLLIRGPYAWLGWAWLGCGHIPFRPPELDVDYGVPLGNCRAIAGQKGVFRREWSKATVELDCAQWKENITFKN